MLVKNYSNLISHGNIVGRKTVLRVIEAGLDAANPYLYSARALGDFVTEGQINAKKGEAKLCNRVHVTFAGSNS